MRNVSLYFFSLVQENKTHWLTGVGTAIGNGANTIGVRERTRYLRHFRRHFATEVSALSEVGAGSAKVDGSFFLLPGFSVAFSLMVTDERQTSFVFPISIVVFS